MLNSVEHEKRFIISGPGPDQHKHQTYKTCKINELEGRSDLIYKQLTIRNIPDIAG